MRIFGLEIEKGKAEEVVEILEGGNGTDLLSMLFGEEGHCPCASCKANRAKNVLAQNMTKKMQEAFGTYDENLKNRAVPENAFFGHDEGIAGELVKKAKVMLEMEGLTRLSGVKEKTTSHVMPLAIGKTNYLVVINNDTLDAATFWRLQAAIRDLEGFEEGITNFLSDWEDKTTKRLPNEDEKKNVPFSGIVDHLIVSLMSDIMERPLLNKEGFNDEQDKERERYYDLEIPERFRALINEEDFFVPGWKATLPTFKKALNEIPTFIQEVIKAANETAKEMSDVAQTILDEKRTEENAHLFEKPIIDGIKMSDVADALAKAGILNDISLTNDE